MTTDAKRFSLSHLISSEISASYIIEGGTAEERRMTAVEIGALIVNLNPEKVVMSPDFIVADTDGGIQSVREILRSMGFKPYGGLRKAIVLPEAQSLTIPAQNALLKALEEPYDTTVLMLTVPDASQLIPTIRSRCQRITLPPSKTVREEKRTLLYRTLLFELAESTLSDRFDLIQSSLKDRDDLPDVLDYWMEYLHDTVHESVAARDEAEALKLAEALSLIQRSRQLIDDNVTPALSLDFMALYLPIIVIPRKD